MLWRKKHPAAEHISLGAGVWDGPPAPGHYAPSQRVPDAWLRQLATQHKDALRGLLTSCRQGRDVALQIAGKLGLTLDSCGAPTEPTDVWLRRATAVQQAVTTRGAQPISLSVLCTPPKGANKAVEATAVQRLKQVHKHLAAVAGTHITDLRLTAPDGRTVGTFAKLMLRYTPNLASLHLTTHPFPLPPASTLPHLTELSVQQNGSGSKGQWTECYRSIAQYLPQLGSLSLRGTKAVYSNWGALFASKQPTHTLTSFQTDELTDELLTALLKYAPALKQLTLENMRGVRESHSDKEGGVEVLVFGMLPPNWEGPFFSLLARLPRAKAGRQVTVTTKHRMTTMELYPNEPRVSTFVSMYSITQCHTFRLSCVPLHMHGMHACI